MFSFLFSQIRDKGKQKLTFEIETKISYASIVFRYQYNSSIFFLQLRQQLDDTRRVLSTTKTQHVLQLEQIEVLY